MENDIVEYTTRGAIASVLADITIGESSTFHNLTIFPFVTTRQQKASYHVVEEALAREGRVATNSPQLCVRSGALAK